MKIASWNVNSLRSRLDQVCRWLEAHPVDVLCLQETKVTDDQFPKPPLEALGYHCYYSGQKSYNGVALVARSPLSQVTRGFAPIVGDANAGDFDEQKRVITGILAGVRIINLYVPNGSEVGSEKYHYKLKWLGLLQTYLQQLQQQETHIHICGDFNIALEDRDIYDPMNKADHIMASPLERSTLQQILDLGFQDAFRKFTQTEGHFSWWDYRAGSFPRNRGWRIDHHYLSAQLYDLAISCEIDVEPRGWQKPSDHTPVILELGSFEEN
jgi:exodeoxyribonuclease-3